VYLFLQPWLVLIMLNFHAGQLHHRYDVGRVVTVLLAWDGWQPSLELEHLRNLRCDSPTTNLYVVDSFFSKVQAKSCFLVGTDKA